MVALKSLVLKISTPFNVMMALDTPLLSICIVKAVAGSSTLNVVVTGAGAPFARTTLTGPSALKVWFCARIDGVQRRQTLIAARTIKVFTHRRRISETIEAKYGA